MIDGGQDSHGAHAGSAAVMGRGHRAADYPLRTCPSPTYAETIASVNNQEGGVSAGDERGQNAGDTHAEPAPLIAERPSTATNIMIDGGHRPCDSQFCIAAVTGRGHQDSVSQPRDAPAQPIAETIVEVNNHCAPVSAGGKRGHERRETHRDPALLTAERSSTSAHP